MRHDPVPAHLQRTALAWARYRQLMKWMAVAVAAALLALLYVSRGEGLIPMLIATLAGVGLTVLLGTGLIVLVFLSNAPRHATTRKGEMSDD